VLQKVFKREAREKFAWGAQQPHVSVRQQALRHLSANIKSQNFNEETSAKERLAHFDVIWPTLAYRLSLRMGMSPTTSAARALLVRLQDLAINYSALASQGGAAGTSLGGLLYNCIKSFPEEISRSLVGGDNPRQVVANRSVTVTSGNTTTSVTLHMLSASDLVSDGATPLRNRVSWTLDSIIGPSDPGMMYLCLGTTILAATGSLESRHLEAGLNSTDFGPAAYTTEHFEYALECGYLASGGRSASANNSRFSTTVLVFPVPRDAVENCAGALTFRDNNPADIAKWQVLVSACRREELSRLPKSDRDRLRSAPFVRGPITSNAEAVDAGRDATMLAGIHQIAFKDGALLETAMEQGDVHVIRVLHQRDHEWAATNWSNRW
jgi:hypothetical protein